MERLIFMVSYVFDIHTHTIASGHGSHATITDMAKAARANGLEMLGISDHGPSTLGGGKPSYFRSLANAPRERLGVRMLYGAEVSILDNNGTLDLDSGLLSSLDYVIASIHPPNKTGTVEENTRAYIAAMEHPFVTVIGHCDDTKYPVDYLALVKAAMEHHVLLEINNNSLSPEGYRGDTRFNDLMLLNLCRHFHYPVIFSSDSHGTAHVGDFTYAAELAAQAKLPEELLLNRSVKNFFDFLDKKS